MSMLVHGYKERGDTLLAQVERLKILENAQLEVTAAKRKRDKAIEDRKGKAGAADVEHVEGDLDDFYDADADALLEDE